MIKVMIVDDEPFIRQGLKILINWEQYGYEISGEASNGKEAVDLMKYIDFELIITDIKMPEMDGFELVSYTWEHISKKIRFIILSGFYEFEYAKKAIKYDVADYVLKPVQKEELIRVLEDYKEQYFRQVENQKKLEYSEKILFDRNLSYLISGKYDNENINYVKKFLLDINSVRYIRFVYNTTDGEFNDLTSEEKRKAQNLLYDTIKDYLGNHWYHAYMEATGNDNDYGVGFIYVKKLAETSALSEKEYFEKIYSAISSALSYKVVIYIGQKVERIGQISDSYLSSTIAKTF
ncbi:MAG TPA: response regulator, partial [Mobilitalea sp.]|nr:response regulator [Mobilitalea sp.]